MMKTINKLGLILSLSATIALFSGCSDQFLKDKKNYGNFSEEIYNDYVGARGRVNFLYANLLPYGGGATTSFGWHSTGNADEYSQSTEEYGGLSVFVDPAKVLGNLDVPDYIYGENKNTSPYGRIRECNLIKEGIEKSTLTEDQKRELLGEVYFFRAWSYYRLVKVYGGIPIIDYVQDPIAGNSNGANLIVPRATTKECIEFMCEDLRLASEYLPKEWPNSASDYGRVTSGAALALQGRIRLLYASPLFNRADDRSRWELAYQSNKAAKELLAYDFGKPGKNASAWANMFSSYKSNEAVFVALFNNIENSNYRRINGWEQSVRPSNIYGGGGKSTTSQMVDIFPMADGKKPSSSIYTKLDISTIPYNEELFFANRDPRFYRTFAFPGEKWSSKAAIVTDTTRAKSYPYSDGTKYELWSYAWYLDAATRDSDTKTGFKADGIGDNDRSIYIRKRSDDYDLNNTALYQFSESFKYTLSAAPYMEIRYGEVLLNFAEAACGAGHYAEAVDALREIRRRVGYTDANDYGLPAGLGTDRAKLFSAILYERQIELAYEGKRFDDMRRWMLWDGGIGQESIKSSWQLTGFDGNTCNYLGVPPLNGTRRTEIEVRVNDARGFAAKTSGSTTDPILKSAAVKAYIIPEGVRPAALDLMIDTTGTGAYRKIDQLVTFYQTNLKRKSIRKDGDIFNTISFQPKYYIIGFRENMQRNNASLKQTVGWEDFMRGNAPGDFDPLAE